MSLYKVYEKTLKNNMKCITIPLKYTNIVSIGIFIKAGSINETLANNGIAHFLEHMMFKGTKHRKGNKLAEELDNAGAEYNAGTSNEYTYYYINGSTKDINLFLEIIIDLYCHPLFNQEDIDKERNVIMEELEMGMDDVSNILLETVHKKMFNHSSLGLPIIGTKENILNFKRDDFIDFRKKNYVPAKSTIIVVGNINSEKVVKKINKEFNKADLEYHNQFLPVVRYDIYQKIPYIYLKEKADLNQTQVILAFRSVGAYSNDCVILDLIADVLSTGFSSRLFNTLRIKLGITYFNFSKHLGYEHEGIFIVHLGVNNSKVLLAIKAVLLELFKLKKMGITSKELAKVKRMNNTSIKLAFQEPRDYMMIYGINSLFSDDKTEFKSSYELKEDPAKNRYSSLNKMKLSDVKNVIKKTFVEHNFNLFVYGSTKEVEKHMTKLGTYINQTLK
jgi:predicted Zn-dependent peptidase